MLQQGLNGNTGWDGTLAVMVTIQHPVGVMGLP